MKLFYRKSGSGKPLIILHGLFGISDNWATLSKQWSEFFTVYAVDLRNHGQSPWDDEWNYKVMAEDVMELIVNEKLEDVMLLGHSMGGKAAMRLALDRPEIISKLLVCDIAPKKYDEHNQQVVDALLKVNPEKISSRKEAENILAQYIPENGTIQFLLKNLYWKDGTDDKQQLAWRFNLEVISKNISIVSEATDAPFPNETETLFLRGERSDYISTKDETEIKNIFPRAQVRTIAGAGHWIHADQPEEMFHAVMKFAR
ncbi:MAG: alpha/beta fold hydrolase [Bacteroidetes bacterium]|nr:alpha/beta fold hydrolase [Bacteroidota bacterium]